MLPSGKRERDAWGGSQAPQLSSDPQISTLVTVATIRTNAANIQAQFGTTHTEMMLDSGSAVSLVRQDVTSDSNTIERMPLPQIQLVTASGDKLPITDCLKASIEVEGQKFTHNFLVVDKLITPVIMGIDFLQQHGLTINFSHTPVSIASAKPLDDTTNEEDSSNLLRPIWDAEQSARRRYCASIGIGTSEDTVDECTVPKFSDPIQFELPESSNPTFASVIQEYKMLFKTLPGRTTAAHIIFLLMDPQQESPLGVFLCTIRMKSKNSFKLC